MEATTMVMVNAASSALASIGPELETARAFAGESKARRTREAYRYQWQTFAAWCEARQLEALPAEPATLAAYLAGRAAMRVVQGRDGIELVPIEGERGWKVASIGLALTAIGQAHKVAGHASPAAHPAVAATWEGIRRRLGTAQRRAAPATVDAVRAMVAALPGLAGTSPRLAALRDRALLVLGFAGAFRRSELVALEVADLAFRAEGLVVTVRRSKTDQEGQGAEVAIAFGGNPATCPVVAVRAWLEASGIAEGLVFRAVDRHGHVGEGLAGAEVGRIVKRAAKGAGLDASRFSGHSLRAGLATTAAAQGRSERRIADQGRWKSRAMVDRYVRDANVFRDNVSAGIGL